MDKLKFLMLGFVLLNWVATAVSSVFQLIAKWVENTNPSKALESEYLDSFPNLNIEPIDQPSFIPGTAKTPHEAFVNNDYMHSLYPYDD